MDKKIINTQGFTLIELMVTLVVAAILLMVAVPNFVGFIQGNQMVAQTERLARDLNYARSEAVKLQQQVTVCKSNDQNTCGVGGVNWHDGWIVFSDENGDGVINGTDGRLRVNAGLDDSFTVTTGGNFTNWVGYEASGRSKGSGVGGNDTFTICRPNAVAEEARRIVISNVGRIDIRQGTVACP